jgi:predicted nucleic acid-binding protein
MSIPYPDVFIAASALKEETVLIHADSHFDLIAVETNLKVESLVSLIA